MQLRNIPVNEHSPHFGGHVRLHARDVVTLDSEEVLKKKKKITVSEFYFFEIVTRAQLYRIAID